MQNKACRLIYILAQLFQKVVSLPVNTTMIFERAPAEPHGAQTFSPKNYSHGKSKNVLLSEFWWIKFNCWLNNNKSIINLQIGLIKEFTCYLQ